MSEIIDGRKLSAKIFEEINLEVLKNKKFGVPGLVTILVGDNPASLSYVTLKIRKANQLGFREKQINLPQDVSQAELFDLIEEYNDNPDFHGILVQLPLPPHIDLNKLILKINPEKDVDGFHPLNMGEMLTQYRKNGLYPCTPKAIVEMIRSTKVETKGKNLVILGRSNLVGKPLAIMCLEKLLLNTTTSVIHSASKDFSYLLQQADIVVACMGKAEFVKSDLIKEGALVIDVGVNKVGTHPESGKAILVGDVDYERVKLKTSFITPVPGGVGPMTIAMLMQNTLQAFKNINKI